MGVEEVLVLKRDRIYRGSLILVNRNYPMRCKKEEVELCHVFEDQPEIRMERESASMMKNLLEGVKSSIVGVSGYRTKEEQIEIFEGSLEENGREFTEKYVAFPDHSEHQTGLAIDLAEKRDEIDFICPEFPYEGDCQKFREKMAFYGFIERYPKEKQDVTGIGAEPWHFRYVGVPHAWLMQEKGMVLEEYVEWIKQFDLQKNPLSLYMKNREVRIGYVKAQGKETKIEGLDVWMDRDRNTKTRIRISGNNMDGFILTCIIVGEKK